MFNRISLFILATLTGGGAIYAVWQDSGALASAAGIAQAAGAVLVVAATLVTWEAVVNGSADRESRLKATALVVLAVGILGLAGNAFFGGIAKAPDGPVFVVSLLLILQAFLTIGHASRAA